jgi:LacI family transcriptional regulator
MAFQRRGMRLDESQVRFANFTAEQAYEVTRETMTSELPPTAIISFSNFVTLGVIRALAELDRKCPDDVSLIGVDDLDWTDIMRLQPTLIAQPIEQMTRAAIGELLLQVEEGTPPSGRRILFPPKLIERSSCGPPPVGPSPPTCLPSR